MHSIDVTMSFLGMGAAAGAGSEPTAAPTGVAGPDGGTFAERLASFLRARSPESGDGEAPPVGVTWLTDQLAPAPFQRTATGEEPLEPALLVQSPVWEAEAGESSGAVPLPSAGTPILDRNLRAWRDTAGPRVARSLETALVDPPAARSEVPLPQAPAVAQDTVLGAFDRVRQSAVDEQGVTRQGHLDGRAVPSPVLPRAQVAAALAGLEIEITAEKAVSPMPAVTPMQEADPGAATASATAAFEPNAFDSAGEKQGQMPDGNAREKATGERSPAHSGGKTGTPVAAPAERDVSAALWRTPYIVASRGAAPAEESRSARDGARVDPRVEKDAAAASGLDRRGDPAAVGTERSGNRITASRSHGNADDPVLERTTAAPSGKNDVRLDVAKTPEGPISDGEAGVAVPFGPTGAAGQARGLTTATPSEKNDVGPAVEREVFRFLDGFGAARGEHAAKIRIHPPELGSVSIRVRVKQKTVSMDLAVDNREVKALLDAHVEALRSELLDRGFTLERFDVSTSGGSKAHGDPGQSQFDGSQGDARNQGEESSPDPLPVANVLTEHRVNVLV